MPAYPTKTHLSVPFTATLKTGPIASTTQQPLLRICLSAPAKSKAPIVMYFRKGSRSQEHGGPGKTLERWWRCELLASTKRGRIIGSASAKGQRNVTRTFNCTLTRPPISLFQQLCQGPWTCLNAPNRPCGHGRNINCPLRGLFGPVGAKNCGRVHSLDLVGQTYPTFGKVLKTA